MTMKRNIAGLVFAGSFGLLLAGTPAAAAPIVPAPLINTTGLGQSAEIIPVHGRGVRGRHCRKAWHPRRGVHRHQRACKNKYRKRYRRHDRWQNNRGCYFYRGQINCRFS